MANMNNNKVGLALGIFFALWHALWAILVAVGIAESFIKWVLPLHFIDMLVGVFTFNIGTAALLVVFAFIGGYVIGWVFAAIWNWLRK